MTALVLATAWIVVLSVPVVAFYLSVKAVEFLGKLKGIVNHDTNGVIAFIGLLVTLLSLAGIFVWFGCVCYCTVLGADGLVQKILSTDHSWAEHFSDGQKAEILVLLVICLVRNVRAFNEKNRQERRERRRAARKARKERRRQEREIQEEIERLEALSEKKLSAVY